MATSITTTPTFSFNLSTPPKPLPRCRDIFRFEPVIINPHGFKTHLDSHVTSLTYNPNHHHHRDRHHRGQIFRSIEVSKEDKPISEQSISPQPISSDPPNKPDPRRIPEKFAILNTGIHVCRSCGYKYDEAIGDETYPVAPGMPFNGLPDDWRCPTCGAAKGFFESKSVEIAGFAENQRFGFGTNGLTAGQKGLLIWGSLGFLFLLFLSGYFLQ